MELKRNNKDGGASEWNKATVTRLPRTNDIVEVRRAEKDRAMISKKKVAVLFRQILCEQSE